MLAIARRASTITAQGSELVLNEVKGSVCGAVEQRGPIGGEDDDMVSFWKKFT